MSNKTENQNASRWIYISPHFDDAILSCGGLIWEQCQSGIPVEIWTLTAGDPPIGPVTEFAAQILAKWNIGTPHEAVNARKIEDRNAAYQVGARVKHMLMVDAIYRKTKKGEFLYPDEIFCDINPQEPGIVDFVARQIAKELKKSDTIVIPLSLGNHVDHVIARIASESLGRVIRYYADIPYLFMDEQSLETAVIDMSGVTTKISPEGLSAWQDGIDCYQSQISSLFEDSIDMRKKISNYCQTRNGLTIWNK